MILKKVQAFSEDFPKMPPKLAEKTKIVYNMI